MNPNIDLQDIAGIRRKRPRENSERNTGRAWKKSEALQRPVLVLAKRRSENCAVTLSVANVQIFHERRNKL